MGAQGGQGPDVLNSADGIFLPRRVARGSDPMPFPRPFYPPDKEQISADSQGVAHQPEGRRVDFGQVLIYTSSRTLT